MGNPTQLSQGFVLFPSYNLYSLFISWGNACHIFWGLILTHFRQCWKQTACYASACYFCDAPGCFLHTRSYRWSTAASAHQKREMSSLSLPTAVSFKVTVLLLQQLPVFWNQTEACERAFFMSKRWIKSSGGQGNSLAHTFAWGCYPLALRKLSSCFRVIAQLWSCQGASVSSWIVWEKWFPVKSNWHTFCSKCFWCICVHLFNRDRTVKAILDSYWCCCVRNLFPLCVVGMWKGLEMMSISVDDCRGDGVVL